MYKNIIKTERNIKILLSQINHNILASYMVTTY